ncbi:MAG TPA: Gfo/Idh/MocA family oxidoreductase [Candidatus Binataceae bacterium]|nr:Gfo/Idh/MocA family oxidoreductase [Candidatus Binataceae bacterium]
MAKDSAAPQVVVVGTNFGCLAHVRALKAAGFEVRALVGRDGNRTRARAREFGVPEALTSYDQALELPGLDAVVISSPPETHKTFTLRALAKGKHVLCEKPLALSTADAREMLEAAGRAGVVHMVEHQFRFRPHDVALRRAVAAGALGKLRQATFVLDADICADPQRMGIPQWWYESRLGGGWLRNLASHQIDLIRYMLGEFETVSADLTFGTDRKMDADDGYSIVFRLRNGMEGILQGSCRAWDFHNVSRVSGTEATASVEPDPNTYQPVLRISDRNGKRAVPMPDDLDVPAALNVLPSPEGTSAYDAIHNVVSGSPEYAMQAAAFRNAIEGRDMGPVTPANFRDGVAHMAVIEAVEESAQRREWVRIDQLPD